MIGSGTSENHHCVCSQLWMHPQSSSTHNAEKIDPNAKSRHILREYLLHEKATLSLSYFAMHTQWLLFTMSTQTANSKAHVFHYLCKLQMITSTFRIISNKFCTNIDHVLNLSQAVLGNILNFFDFHESIRGEDIKFCLATFVHTFLLHNGSYLRLPIQITNTYAHEFGSLYTFPIITGVSLASSSSFSFSFMSLLTCNTMEPASSPECAHRA